MGDRCLMAINQFCRAKRQQFKATKTCVHLQILVPSAQLQSKIHLLQPFRASQISVFHRDLKCKDASLSLKDLTGGKELEVKPAGFGNETYAEMENRTQDCVLNMVGKPVFHNYLDMKHGSWLRDPIMRENITVEKIWLTKESEPNNLYEYKNREDYRKSKPSRNQPYKLPCPFKVGFCNLHKVKLNFSFTNLPQGNAHIVYNSNFYYFCADGPKIVRYDLKSEQVKGKRQSNLLTSIHSRSN